MPHDRHFRRLPEAGCEAGCKEGEVPGAQPPVRLVPANRKSIPQVETAAAINCSVTLTNRPKLIADVIGATDGELANGVGAIVSDSGPSGSEPNLPSRMLLAAHAAGSLCEPFAVLVASHLQMRGESSAAGTPISSQQRLPRTPMPGWDQIDAIMPLALRAFVARHNGAPEWRAFLPGIERCRIRHETGADAYLLRCRPGSAIPMHTHRGREAVLVLQGGFRDATGHYGVGDIAVADPTIEHRPVADRTDTCIIIFVVLEAPVKLTGLIGRLLQRVFGA